MKERTTLLLLLISFTLLYLIKGCSIHHFSSKLIACSLSSDLLNVEDVNGIVPNQTQCLIDTGSGGIHAFRCLNDNWDLEKAFGNDDRTKPKRRRKRGFWRSVGRFFEGVGHAIETVVVGVVETVACVASLFGCLFGGRAGPPQDQTPPVFDYCPKDYVHSTADPFQIYGQATWIEPTATDDTDGKIIPRRISGRAPGRHFPEKITEVKYMATDRSGNVAYCSVYVKVEVIRCPDPVPLINGYFVCHPSTEFVLGGWCKFGCYDGFDLDGSAETTCQKNKSWTHNQPRCIPIECPAFPKSLIEDAGMPNCTNNTYFRSICTFNCKSGYDMPPTVSKALLCTINKTWRKHGEPKCIDIEPPQFETCPSIQIRGTHTGVNTAEVSWNEPKVTDNSGKYIKAELKGRYRPGSKMYAGSYHIVYGATDDDGNEAKVCSFNVIVRDIRCPKLYPTPFVQIVCPRSYRTGVFCNVSCDSGKKLNATQPSVQCLQSDNGMYGYWNWDRQATCLSTHSCESLKPPQNGAVACDNWQGGEFCQVQCRNGTNMVGSRLETLYACSSVGEWFPTPLIRPCKVERRPQPHIGITAYYFFDGVCTEETTRQEIADNFISRMENSDFKKEACPDNSKECKPEYVQVTCGETGRKRRDVSNKTNHSTSYDLKIAFQMPILFALTEDSFVSAQNLIIKTFENIKSAIFDNGTMHFGNGSTLYPLSVGNTGIEINCPAGTMKSGSNVACVDCPEGTYYQTRTGTCESCKIGFYQDTVAAMECKQCSFRTTTRSKGAMAIAECEDACSQGRYSKDGVMPCSPCEIGSYQPSYGQTTCHTCRGGKSTLGDGSDSIKDCQEFDIEFPKDGRQSAILYLRETIEINEFTVSLWVRKDNDFSTNPDVILYDQNDTAVWSLRSLQNTTHNYSGNADVNLNIRDRRWHHMIIQSRSCNISAYLNGIIVSTIETTDSCTAIELAKVAIKTDDGFEGGVSQLNIWNSGHFLPPQSKCFTPSTGNVISWQSFGEANITGAYINMPSQCDDFDNCAAMPCLNGHCTDALHNFNCECLSGFTGTQCETNIDDCDVNICMNNSTCVDSVASYNCACPSKLTGKYCEIEMVNGQWSEPGNWSECSTTCGDGEQRRRRLCNNPTPANGGKACVGLDVDIKYCNNTHCPVCPVLLPPGNGSIKCENGSDFINCTIECDSGYDFDIQPLRSYFCGPNTFHEWNFQTIDNPRRKFPNCIAIQLPEKLTVHYSAKYQDLYCLSEEVEGEAEENIAVLVETIINDLPCIQNGTCALDEVKIKDCDHSKRNKRRIETAGFTLTISSQPKTDNGTVTLPDLQDAFQSIQGAADSGQFTLDILDDDYELEGRTTSISGDVQCGGGMTRVNFYCIPCGIGTYLYNDYCKPCYYGTYQDNEGQSNCIQCPQGKSTIGVLSTSPEDCSVEVIQDKEDPVKVTAIVLGCCAAVIVVVLVVYIYRRYRSRLEKLVEPTDINISRKDVIGPSKKRFEYTSETVRSSQSDSIKTVFASHIQPDGRVLHHKPWK